MNGRHGWLHKIDKVQSFRMIFCKVQITSFLPTLEILEKKEA